MKTKTILSGALFGVAMLAAAPAFAERWTEPVNGTVSAVSMPDGSVMMRIKLPAKPFGMISRDMRENHMNCTMQSIDVSSDQSVILVCGGG